jgi:hypothetical protein
VDHPIAVRSLGRCEGVNPLTPQQVKDSSRNRASAFVEVSVPYHLKSRVAIPRIDQSRRSSGGHVAEDPDESGFGGIGVSRVVKRSHIESRSAIPRVNLGR